MSLLSMCGHLLRLIEAPTKGLCVPQRDKAMRPRQLKAVVENPAGQ